MNFANRRPSVGSLDYCSLESRSSLLSFPFKVPHNAIERILYLRFFETVLIRRPPIRARSATFNSTRRISIDMNYPSDNPYSSTQQSTFSSADSMNQPISRSIVSQVRVIAILLIVHGAILVAASIFYFIFAAIMPTFLANQPQGMPQQPNGPTPQQMSWILVVTYSVMGAAAVIPGLLQLYAGIRNLSLKGRTLGIIALISGCVSVLTCYCAPTSIALLVYGLIIYLNPSAQEAFRLGENNVRFDDILNGAPPAPRT